MSKQIIGYIIVIVVFFLLGRSCRNEFKCSGVKPIVDTVITTKSDTFWAKDTVIQFKYKSVNKPYIVYLNPKDSSKKDTIKVYSQTFEDTNLTVTTVDTVSGNLLGQSLKYKLKVPIKIVDSVFVNITNTIENKPTKKLFLGVNTQIYPQLTNITPTISYQDKHDRLFHIGYNVINNGVYGGVSVKIKFRK